MLKTGMRVLRSHPILAAAGVGAIFGGVNAIILEIGGLRHRASTGVLPFLFPSSMSGIRAGQMTALQVSLLLLIEIAGNVLGFSLLLAVPVAVIVGVRRLFRREKSEPLPESEES